MTKRTNQSAGTLTFAPEVDILSADKHECILKAAVRAFSLMGFRKTSIEEVAQEAGVGKGTIYLAVNSKDELFLSAVEREVKGFLNGGRPILGMFDDAVELVAGLVQSELREALKRPLVRQLLVGQTLATVPQAEVECERLLTRARDNLVGALDRLQEGGALRDDLERDTAARLLQDLEIAALVRSERAKDPEDAIMRADWRQTVGLMVRGMRRPLNLGATARRT